MFTETFTSGQRKQLQRLFRRHHGAQRIVAARAGVTAPSVSRWIRGDFVSAKIAKHAVVYAAELEAMEVVQQ